MRVLMITPKKVVNLFLLFSLLPYVSLVPLGSDVQVVAGFLAYSFIGLLLLRGAVYFDWRELGLLLLGCLFLLNINMDEDTYQLRKAIGPLYGFGVFYVSKRYHHLFDKRVVYFVVAVYIVGAIIQLVSADLFVLTLERFLRKSKYAEEGARGVTSMATEPSFLGMVSIYLILILNCIEKKEERKATFYIFFIGAVILVLLSKSGTGYVVLFVYLIYNSKRLILKYWLHIFLIVSFASIVLSLSNTNIGSNKGLHELGRIFSVTSPQRIIQIPSISLRINPAIVGWYGLMKNPIGNGSGAFTTQAIEVYSDNRLYDLYSDNKYVQERLVREISTDSVSTFGKYSFEYGVFFLIYLTIIFYGIDYKRISWFTLFLIGVTLLFSLPIVYPPMWVLLGIFDKYSKKVAK